MRKKHAVEQILKHPFGSTERGYLVPHLAAQLRLGVSTVWRWVKKSLHCAGLCSSAPSVCLCSWSCVVVAQRVCCRARRACRASCVVCRDAVRCGACMVSYACAAVWCVVCVREL